MAQASYPNLSKSTAQLTADNARIMNFTDGLPSRVDKLVEATLAEDWAEVRQVVEYMMRSGNAEGRLDISSCAEQVCDEMDKPDNRLAIQPSLLQSLFRLVAACGSAPDAPLKRKRSQNRNAEKPVG